MKGTMEDETNPNPEPTPEVTPTATPPANPPVAEKTVPYDRFKSVNDEKKALEARIAELSTSAQSAEQLQAQVKELSGRLLRGQVAAAVGLPAELADRLRGDDEAALTADAEALLKMIPKRQAAPPINGDTPNPGEKIFTMAQIADPAFYQKHRDEIMQAQREGRIRA